MGALQPSGQALVRLTEALVYKSTEWDSNLKTWIRSGKTMFDIIETQTMKETLENIISMVHEERPDRASGGRVNPNGKLTGTVQVEDVCASDEEATTEVQQILREKDPEGKLSMWRRKATEAMGERTRLIKEPDSY
eukprot:5174311-Pyramimonas_sp.AAC.1